MKINYKNQDLKIINRILNYSCHSCEFLACNYDIFWCSLFCRPGKIWIKDIFNSAIFRL